MSAFDPLRTSTLRPLLARMSRSHYNQPVNTGLGPLPPHLQLFDFLPKTEHGRLLEWVLNNSGAFVAATVTNGKSGAEANVEAEQRIALTTRKLNELEATLKPRFADVLEYITETTGYRGPRPSSLELELAAHGNGAHYKPHLDIPLGQDRAPLGSREGEDRALSAVYYFYCEPKRFSGGELRLYSFGSGWNNENADASSYVDLQPVNNSLVVFPSWAMHEVRPVQCPSGEFRDHRFAVNCWYCRATD